MNEYFITCPRGLEEVTAKDIASHITCNPTQTKGGVSFKGTLEDMYKINLYTRTGMYVLKKLIQFKANNFNKVYKNIFDCNWEDIIGCEKTFLIRTKVKSSIFENSGFVTLKIKDAIVDKIKKKKNKRPNINVKKR